MYNHRYGHELARYSHTNGCCGDSVVPLSVGSMVSGAPLFARDGFLDRALQYAKRQNSCVAGPGLAILFVHDEVTGVGLISVVRHL